jgi:type VI secretion system protein ImpM
VANESRQGDTPVNPRIGLFGKVPAAGDFIAFNASTAVGRTLDQWLRDGIDNVLARKKPPPQQPVRFLYRDPRGMTACIGVMVPSADKVGRRFPICAYAELDMPVATMRFSSLPAAYAHFLDAAARILEQEAATASPEALAEQIGRLAPPGPAELAEANAWANEALQVTPGQTVLEALFGPLAGGVHYHALNMARAACLRLRGNAVAVADTILDCTASDDVQLLFWTRLVNALLQWRQAPASLVWNASDSRDTRLLIALGSPDPSLIHFLADPNLTAERLWPMKTTDVTTIQRGRASLPATLLAALEPPAPTAEQIIVAAAT